MPSDDISKARAHVLATIGPPDQWTAWPGGWTKDIESALVDAVFSAQAVYQTNNGRGIAGNIARWQPTRNRTAFSLGALVADIDAVGIPKWAKDFGNRQVSPGRRVDAPGGPKKTAAVREAADKLMKADVNVASDVSSQTAIDVKTALRSVSGIGYATANYFLMLLGAPEVKPDRMIHRFLREATGHDFTNADADDALCAVAQHFGAEAHVLDHAIWLYERSRDC